MTALTSLDGSPVFGACLGTQQFGSKADYDMSRRMFDAARARRITLFDTMNDGPGSLSEPMLGEFAAPDRARIFISTKRNPALGPSAKPLRDRVTASLAALDTDYIDLYSLAGSDDETALARDFAALAALVEAGSVRHVGLVRVTPDQLRRSLTIARQEGVKISTVQVMYNLVRRDIEAEVLPFCRRERIVVLSNSTLAGGLLAANYAAGEPFRHDHDRMVMNRYATEWMHRAAANLAKLAEERRTTAATIATAWVMRSLHVLAPILSARRLDHLDCSLAAINFEGDADFWRRVESLARSPEQADETPEHLKPVAQSA